jgi:hypothetical protein
MADSESARRDQRVIALVKAVHDLALLRSVASKVRSPELVERVDELTRQLSDRVLGLADQIQSRSEHTRAQDNGVDRTITLLIREAGSIPTASGEAYQRLFDKLQISEKTTIGFLVRDWERAVDADRLERALDVAFVVGLATIAAAGIGTPDAFVVGGDPLAEMLNTAVTTLARVLINESGKEVNGPTRLQNTGRHTAARPDVKAHGASSVSAAKRRSAQTGGKPLSQLGPPRLPPSAIRQPPGTGKQPPGHNAPDPKRRRGPAGPGAR